MLSETMRLSLWKEESTRPHSCECVYCINYKGYGSTM